MCTQKQSWQQPTNAQSVECKQHTCAGSTSSLKQRRRKHAKWRTDTSVRHPEWTQTQHTHMHTNVHTYICMYINIQHWWLLLSVTKFRLNSGLSDFFLLDLLFRLLLLHDNCKSVLFEIMMLHSERWCHTTTWNDYACLRLWFNPVNTQKKDEVHEYTVTPPRPLKSFTVTPTRPLKSLTVTGRLLRRRRSLFTT